MEHELTICARCKHCRAIGLFELECCMHPKKAIGPDLVTGYMQHPLARAVNDGDCKLYEPKLKWTTRLLRRLRLIK